MQNLKITVPLLDGAVVELDEETGADQIEVLAPGLRPAPTGLVLQATADDGRRVTITIPNTTATKARVLIE